MSFWLVRGLVFTVSPLQNSTQAKKQLLFFFALWKFTASVEGPLTFLLELIVAPPVKMFAHPCRTRSMGADGDFFLFFISTQTD